MITKRIISMVTFAIIAVILYWARAEFDVSLSKYATTNAHENIDFNWGTCLIWATVGAAIGAIPLGSKKKS